MAEHREGNQLLVLTPPVQAQAPGEKTIHTRRNPTVLRSWKSWSGKEGMGEGQLFHQQVAGGRPGLSPGGSFSGEPPPARGHLSDDQCGVSVLLGKDRRTGREGPRDPKAKGARLKPRLGSTRGPGAGDPGGQQPGGAGALWPRGLGGEPSDSPRRGRRARALPPGARRVSRPGVPGPPHPQQFPGCLCMSFSFTRGCSLSLLGSFRRLRRRRERARACPPAPAADRSGPAGNGARRSGPRTAAAAGATLPSRPAPCRRSVPVTVPHDTLACTRLHPQAAWLRGMWVPRGRRRENRPMSRRSPSASAYVFVFWGALKKPSPLTPQVGNRGWDGRSLAPLSGEPRPVEAPGFCLRK